MYNFFSNNVLYIDGENIDRVDYKGNPNKPTTLKDFKVPNHNKDTDNLLVFVNGSLRTRGVHYRDINSSTIQFTPAIYTSYDITAIVIRGSSVLEWGYF